MICAIQCIAFTKSNSFQYFSKYCILGNIEDHKKGSVIVYAPTEIFEAVPEIISTTFTTMATNPDFITIKSTENTTLIE